MANRSNSALASHGAGAVFDVPLGDALAREASMSEIDDALPLLREIELEEIGGSSPVQTPPSDR